MKKALHFIFFCFCFAHTATAQVPAYIPTSGLIGWYPFNGNAYNEYGPLPDARVFEAVPAPDRAGIANKAYHFDGIDDHITIDSAFFNINWSDYTMSCWMQLDTLSNPFNSNGSHILFNTIPHRGLALSYNWGSTDRFHIWAGNHHFGGWTVLSMAESAIPVPLHTWQHVAIVRQHDTAFSIYINGELDTTFISHIATPSFDFGFTIGTNDTMYSDEAFMGSLDDVGIWTQALRGCDIKKMYEESAYSFLTTAPTNTTVPIGGSAGFTVAAAGTGLSYAWQMNAGSGFVPLSPGAPYSGTTTNTLTISPVTSSMTGNRYRCIVSGISSECVDTSSYGILNPPPTQLNEASFSEISVSPNPATDLIHISGTTNADVLVCDMAGRALKSFRNVSVVSLSGLPAGTYMLRITDMSNMHTYRHKVVKE